MAGIKPIIFAVLVVAMVVIGVLDVLVTKGENKCEMTYMFERPEYVVMQCFLFMLYFSSQNISFFVCFCDSDSRWVTVKRL